MELIKDYTQYSSGVHDFRIGQRKLVTNNLLLREKIEQYIERRGMWIDKFSNALFIYCDDADFYSLIYFLPENLVNGPEYPNIQLDKPVVIEIISQERGWLEKYREVIGYWEKLGFSAFKMYRRMKVSIKDHSPSSQKGPQCSATTSPIGYAKSSHISYIKRIWRENLEIIGNKFPADKELLDQINQQQILISLDHKGEIIATVQFLPKGDTCILKHLVVDQEYRKQGLARGLYKQWFLDHPEILTCTLWVEDQNLSAIQLYSSLGFEFDGLISWQYVKS